jgi:hypothetical protein
MVVADRTVRNSGDAEGYICIVKNLNDGHRAIGEAVIILTSSLRQFRLDKIEVCCGLTGGRAVLAPLICLTESRETRLMPVGLFRSEDGWVQVDYGTGTNIPVVRSKYEANRYKPDFDKLPSEAEYRAAEKKKEDDPLRP